MVIARPTWQTAMGHSQRGLKWGIFSWIKQSLRIGTENCGRVNLMTHLRVAVRHSTNSTVKLLSCLFPLLGLAFGVSPYKHLCFVALPSWATMVIVIMLPQQHSAPKTRAIMLVEDFKFHTRTVGGNGTWGGFAQGANWGGDTPPVSVPRQAFIQIADAGTSN